MDDIRQFNIRMPDAIVQRLKVEAVERRTYPNAIVRQLLEQHFREQDDRTGVRSVDR